MWRKLAYLCLIIGFSLGLLAFLVIDFSPDVQVSSSQQVDGADAVKSLLSESRELLRRRNSANQIEISEAQANSLAGFLQRAHKRVAGITDYSNNGVNIRATYLLSPALGGIYLNLHTRVNSAKGVELDYVKVGNLYLPGAFALSVAEFFANTYTSSDVATVAINTVDEIDVEDKVARIKTKPILPLLIALKSVDTGSGTGSGATKQKVVSYLQFLDKLPRNPESNRTLNYYLVKLMAEARAKSIPVTAAQENEAAIMALAVYAGNRRFAAAIGNISVTMGRIPTANEPTTLAGRRDLSLHFIYSAAIKLLSEQGISIAVGEFKELMDRAQGGSGYSFIDLAADLAGAQFAAVAVDPQRARYVQDMIINSNSENAYFPSIENLEEGMSKEEFEKRYGHVDSVEYQKVVSLITERVEALPISR